MTLSPIPAPGLTVRLFGQIEVLVEGEPLPPLRSRKALWALTLLVLRDGRTTSREWLAATIWPDAERGVAFGNLRPVLADLRRALGREARRLRSPDRFTIDFDFEGCDVDLFAFDAAMRSGDPSDVMRGIGLYRGALAEGCTEEWVFQDRAAREHDCLRAILRLAESAAESGELEAAARWYRRAVELDPWWDTAHRGLMTVLAGLGDVNEALHVYRSFYEALRSGAGSTPDEETTALYERLRAQSRKKARPFEKTAPASSGGAKGSLPHPVNELIGRVDEQIEVLELLRTNRLVTLTGFGGIGKTSLAVRVASTLAGSFDDGAWMVSLESVSDPSRTFQQIGVALGLKERPNLDWSDQVVDHLRGLRALLIVDNCEHLLGAAARAVDQILRACSGVRVLATSREALRIAGEYAWSVPPLAVPEPEHLPKGLATMQRVLLQFDGVRLFIERARAVDRRFGLSGHNAFLVAQICARLDGIPLAIELAAARTRSMTVEEVAEGLEDRLGLLTQGNRTALSRQRTLRSTLDWSYDLLNDQESALFRRLSIFAGGWTLAAAENVCSGEAEPATETLGSLVDKSLVEFQGSDGLPEGRFRMLEMVRQYAREKLQAADEANERGEAHRQWFLLFAETAGSHLRGPEHHLWMKRLQAEQSNLRSALDRSMQETETDAAGLRLAAALGRFWQIKGDYEEGIHYLTEALRGGEGSPSPARGKALAGLGDLAMCRSDFPRARAFYEESLNIRRALDDVAGCAHCLSSLANLSHEEGDETVADVLIKDALRTARMSGSGPDVAASLVTQATLMSTVGDDARAYENLEEALGIYRALGDAIGLARCLSDQSDLRNIEQDPLVREARQREALQIFRTLGDRSGVAMVLLGLGQYRIAEGDDAGASDCLQEALELYRTLGDRRGVVVGLVGLGRASTLAGDYALAIESIQASLSMAGEFSGRGGCILGMEALAFVLARLEEWDRALRLLGFSQALRREIDSFLKPHRRQEYQRCLTGATIQLGQRRVEAALKAGESMALAEALALALHPGPLPALRTPSGNLGEPPSDLPVGKPRSLAST